MADRIRDVGGGANHYATLSAWEAGEQGNLPSLDERRIANCFAFSDTTAVVVAGWTVDATRYPMVTVDPSARHGGAWNTSAYRLEVSGAHAISIQQTHFRMEYVQVSVSESGATQRFAVDLPSSATMVGVYIEKCLVRQAPGSSGSGNLRGIRLGNGGTVFVSNTIVQGFRQGSGSGISRSAGTMYVHYCGAYDCNIGIGAGSGPVNAKNCWARACTDGFQGTFGAAGTLTDYNISDLAGDAPGTNVKNSTTVALVNPGTDFKLQSGDTAAKDWAPSLSADANYPVTDDFLGTTRPGSACDAGPHEYSAPPSSGSQVARARSRRMGALVQF